MKIETKYYNYILYPAVIGGLVYGIRNIMQDSKNYTGVDDLKIEIARKDPKRYDSLMHDGKPRHSFIDWQYEVDKMNDSLRTDSMIKRAYFEGEQRVRDSIKNKERESYGI